MIAIPIFDIKMLIKKTSGEIPSGGFKLNKAVKIE